MDAAKEARRREYLALKAAKQKEIEYFQNLNERAKILSEHFNKPVPKVVQSTDPDLPRSAEIVQEDPDDKLYGHKEAKETLKKAKELEENKDYLESLNKKEKTPKPDFTDMMGKTAGGILNSLEDKLSPLTARDEDEGDYTPISLDNTPDAPLRVLKTVDNFTGRPVRRAVYEMLGGTPKKEVEGSDIRQQLETKTGKLYDVVGKPLELAADFGLDWTNLIPMMGAAGVGRKLATKFTTNPEMLEHMASIAAKKTKDAKVLKQSEDLYKAMRERPDAFNANNKAKILEVLRGQVPITETQVDKIVDGLKAKKVKDAEEAAAKEAFKSEFNLPVAHGTSSEKIAERMDYSDIEDLQKKLGKDFILRNEVPDLVPDLTINRFKSNRAFNGEGIYSHPYDPKQPSYLGPNYKPNEYAVGKGSQVIPLQVRGGKTFNFDNNIHPSVADLIPNSNQSFEKLSKLTGTPVDELKQLSMYDIEKLVRRYPNDFENLTFQGQVKTFDPKNLRSPFAKFNPTMKESGDILAGLGGAGIVGASAMSSPEANASEMKSPSKADVLKTLRGED